MPKSVVKAVVLSVFDTAGITVPFQAINPNGLDFACNVIRIMNASNIDVTISYNGFQDQEVVLAHSTFEFTAQANANPTGDSWLWKKGQVVYVAAPAVGIGNVYLSGYYAQP